MRSDTDLQRHSCVALARRATAHVQGREHCDHVRWSDHSDSHWLIRLEGLRLTGKLSHVQAMREALTTPISAAFLVFTTLVCVFLYIVS